MAHAQQAGSMRAATTAVVLCGGAGARLGGADKPLLELAGKPLLGHVLARLAPQVATVVLACADARTYQRFGHRMVVDDAPRQGPLGGIVSALGAVATEWVCTSPADTPFLPTNLVAKLAIVGRRHGAAAAVAGGRRQNLSVLLNADRAASLAAFYAAGGRALHQWLDANRAPTAAFPAAAFLNVNTQANLRTARRMFAEQPP